MNRLHSFPKLDRARGVGLVEVLITMVVLAFGLLVLAALATKCHM